MKMFLSLTQTDSLVLLLPLIGSSTTRYHVPRLCFGGLMPVTGQPELDLVCFLLLVLPFWWESLEF